MKPLLVEPVLKSKSPKGAVRETVLGKNFHACTGERAARTGERERGRGREREGEGERETETERGRGRKRDRQRQR